MASGCDTDAAYGRALFDQPSVPIRRGSPKKKWKNVPQYIALVP